MATRIAGRLVCFGGCFGVDLCAQKRRRTGAEVRELLFTAEAAEGRRELLWAPHSRPWQSSAALRALCGKKCSSRFPPTAWPSSPPRGGRRGRRGCSRRGRPRG